MDEEQFFKNLKEALFKRFGQPATPKNLSTEFGSKTIKMAKKVGVFVARKAGYSNATIAAQFGFSSGKSASRVFNNAAESYKDNDHEFLPYARAVAEDVSVALDGGVS